MSNAGPDLEQWLFNTFRDPEETSDVLVRINDIEGTREVTQLKLHKNILKRAAYFLKGFAFDTKKQSEITINLFDEENHTVEVIKKFFSFFYCNVYNLSVTDDLIRNAIIYHQLSTFFLFAEAQNLFFDIVSDHLSVDCFKSVIDYAYLCRDEAEGNKDLLLACVNFLSMELKHFKVDTQIKLLSCLRVRDFLELMMSPILSMDRNARVHLVDDFRKAKKGELAPIEDMQISVIQQRIDRDEDCISTLAKDRVILELRLSSVIESDSQDVVRPLKKQKVEPLTNKTAPSKPEIRRHFTAYNWNWCIKIKRNQKGPDYDVGIFCWHPNDSAKRKTRPRSISLDFYVINKRKTKEFHVSDVFMPGKTNPVTTIDNFLTKEELQNGFWKKGEQKRIILIFVRLAMSDVTLSADSHT
jgi:hypothetical protein